MDKLPKHPKDSLFNFPCEFTLKVFGFASDRFELEVITLVRRHVSQLREDALSTRLSRDQKYLALSITFIADSQEQLDNIYRDLSASPHILMAL